MARDDGKWVRHLHVLPGDHLGAFSDTRAVFYQKAAAARRSAS